MNNFSPDFSFINIQFKHTEKKRKMKFIEAERRLLQIRGGKPRDHYRPLATISAECVIATLDSEGELNTFEPDRKAFLKSKLVMEAKDVHIALGYVSQNELFIVQLVVYSQGNKPISPEEFAALNPRIRAANPDFSPSGDYDVFAFARSVNGGVNVFVTKAQHRAQVCSTEPSDEDERSETHSDEPRSDEPHSDEHHLDEHHLEEPRLDEHHADEPHSDEHHLDEHHSESTACDTSDPIDICNVVLPDATKLIVIIGVDKISARLSEFNTILAEMKEDGEYEWDPTWNPSAILLKKKSFAALVPDEFKDRICYSIADAISMMRE